MNKLALISTVLLVAFPGLGAVNVPLTVQEAVYPGSVAGVNRTNETFCMGVPTADAEGIKSAGTLGLSGVTAGQFRILGTWPSGNAKWVKVCGVVPSTTAGGTNTVTLTAGSGDFGGTPLATDGGATITVSTGAATFVVKKANFNGIDSAAVGGKTVVAPSTAETRGFVLMGPNPNAAYPANVTCGTGAGQSPCTTLYSSANDAGSTCSIEENGPVTATLKCTGTHFDNAGHPYMQFTARLSFYKQKSHVKVASILRNANYDSATDAAGKTFNSAFKGLQSYELRVQPNITGTLNYQIAADSSACSGGVCSGTVSGAESARIYQARSTLLAQQTDCGLACAAAASADLGYSVWKNSTVVASNADGTKSPTAFYADIADASGSGVQIGVYQGASYWPKSLEFLGGGTDVRIGMWPRDNSQAVYQAWPSWSINNLFLNFHASSPASPASDFLAYQHYLVARADRTYYNATQVFPYPLPDASRETAFYQSVLAGATYADGSHPLATAPADTYDLGTSMGGWPLAAYRFKFWPEGGPGNQEEFRWSNLMRFLRTGQTGRMLDSAHFYKMQAENAWPHSDGVSSSDRTVNGFLWSQKPISELDGFGRPRMACGGTYPGDSCATLTNSSLSFQDWYDALHFHWYGMMDYYFLTGDETMREAMTSAKSWYMNDGTFQAGAGGGIGIIRGIGVEMLSASRFSDYLRAVGDPDYAPVLAQAEKNYTMFVKPEGCMNGFPAGCQMPPAEPTTAPAADPPGVSRLRGAPASTVGRGTGRCGTGPQRYYRGIAAFYASLMNEGLLALRKAKGATWSDYNLSLDLAYGISQFTLSEMFSDDGGSYFWKGGGINGTRAADTLYNGFRYSVTYDVPFACPDGTPVVAGTTAQFSSTGPVVDVLTLPLPAQSMFMNFYIQQLVNGTLTPDQLRKFKIAMAWVRGQGQSSADLGQYQIATVFHAMDEASSSTLNDVPFTVQSTGPGTYRLSWTVPAGLRSGQGSPYRIKWSRKIIAPSKPGMYPGIGTVDGLLNYDPIVKGTFGLDPNVYATWFGADGVSDPAASAAGQVQTFDIDTRGVSGLTAQNFSVKAYSQGTSTPTPTPTTSAAGLQVSGYPASSAAGATGLVVVRAVDAAGSVVTGYTGTVRITSSDPAATLPAPYTFTAADAGTHAFAITLNTVGAGKTITATDVASATLTGTQSGVAVTAAPSAQPANLVYVSGNNQQGSVQTGAAGATVNWTHKPVGSNWAGATGFAQMFFDPFTKKTIYYGVPLSTASIYASDIFFYDPMANSFLHGPGTGVMQPSCTIDSATQPGERHPYWQMAIDTKRNVMWLASGVNQTCNGNGAGPDGSPRQDMYYLKLNGSDPGKSDWHRVTPPNALSRIEGAMAYDSDNDVVFFFGYPANHPNFVYCPTIDAATGIASGVLTQNQKSAGCKAPDDWSEVEPNNGLVNVTGTAVTLVSGNQFTFFAPGDYMLVEGAFFQIASITDGTHLTLTSDAGIRSNKAYGIVPPGVAQPGLVYDTATKKMIMFGGGSQGVFYNQTWAYDVLQKMWIHKGLSTPAPPFQSSASKYIAQPEMSYDPVGQKIYYHQVGVGVTSDWRYDPVADTWTQLGTVGTGPARDSMMSYDTGCNCLITLSNIGGQGSPVDMWVGSVGQGAAVQPLGSPLVVKVTSSTGAAVPNVAVTFTVTSTQGTLTGGTRQQVVNTDAQGMAAVTFTPGATAGTYTVTASYGSGTSPVTFTATVGGGVPTTTSACDLNGDNVTNAVDVQLAISQTLGTNACGNADLDKDGKCTVIDVQRVIAAGLGNACRVGP